MVRLAVGAGAAVVVVAADSGVHHAIAADIAFQQELLVIAAAVRVLVEATSAAGAPRATTLERALASWTAEVIAT